MPKSPRTGDAVAFIYFFAAGTLSKAEQTSAAMTCWTRWTVQTAVPNSRPSTDRLCFLSVSALYLIWLREGHVCRSYFSGTASQRCNPPESESIFLTIRQTIDENFPGLLSVKEGKKQRVHNREKIILRKSPPPPLLQRGEIPHFYKGRRAGIQSSGSITARNYSFFVLFSH